MYRRSGLKLRRHHYIANNKIMMSKHDEKIYVIHDCDNTFGIKGRPVDDGLALLYLLGKPTAELVGVTATYGNGTVNEVYENTINMLRYIGRGDIPVSKGAASKENRYSEAAEFLVEQADRFEGKLKILATGALTNLCGAYGLDNGFFDKLGELVLMGGITEPLYLNGITLDELNFSCDPEAAYCVLSNAKNVSIATGNNCLPAYFTHEEYRRRLTGAPESKGLYIYGQTKSWFDEKVKIFDLNGFYAWDEVAAVYLLEKGLFENHEHICTPSTAGLQKGYIDCHKGYLPAFMLNLPSIKDAGLFKEELYTSWLGEDL